MGRAKAHVDVPGRAFEAEQLWYDTSRWPAFVDGLQHVVQRDDGWPQAPGARVVWESTPGGRGRVVETVESHEARAGQAVLVEDDSLRGTQRVRFAPRDDGVRVELALDYALKGGRLLAPVLDALFVRRSVRDSLRRTLDRFARELRSDREHGG